MNIDLDVNYLLFIKNYPVNITKVNRYYIQYEFILSSYNYYSSSYYYYCCYYYYYCCYYYCFYYCFYYYYYLVFLHGYTSIYLLTLNIPNVNPQLMPVLTRFNCNLLFLILNHNLFVLSLIQYLNIIINI